ncbi:MAG: heavy-metal-associated domain-containing protein [Proteobacteria bacterium]|nr:heavy-metal-associated domain-containing protein [Pseudomonadota bacterium]
MTTIYQIKGMSCAGCARSITNSIKKIEPNARIHVDVVSGHVTVEGQIPESVVQQAAVAAGFEFSGRITG